MFKDTQVQSSQNKRRLENAIHRYSALSHREQEIVIAFIEQPNIEALSKNLHISQNTVRAHFRNICLKTNVSSKAELLAKIIRDLLTNY